MFHINTVSRLSDDLGKVRIPVPPAGRGADADSRA